jgi:Flp pilus assembly protein TadD
MHASVKRLLLLAVGVLCASAAQAQETATLLGRVRMVDGTPPAERVLVTLETRGVVVNTAFTDSQGQFAFYNLISNPYHVSLRVDGYQPVRETITVNPAISPTFHVRIQLSPILRPPAAEKEQPSGASFVGNPHRIAVADYAQKFPPAAVKEFEKGMAAEQGGRDDDAIKHYQKAIGIEADFYPARNNLGIRYLNKRKFTDAEVQFEAVIRLRPGDAQGYFNLGNVFALTGRLADAERTLHEGLKHEPDAAMGHFLLGYVYLRAGQYEEAERRLAWALQMDRSFSKARIELANLYLQQKKRARAIEELKRFVQEYPKDPLLPQVNKLLAKLEAEEKSTR